MSKITEAIQTLSSLEELALEKSPIHRLHPGVKIIITFTYLIAVLSFNRYNLTGLIGLFFYPALIIPLAGIPFSAIIKRVIIALPFSLFAGISNLIFERTTASYILGLPITYGVISFSTLMLKTLLCVSAVLILAATTGTFDLFGQLRRFKIPKVLVLTIMMTYRYIFLLLLEVANMTKAYHMRAPNEKGIRMKDMGSFVGQLLLRCFDRSERIYVAMESRGFHGEYSGMALTKLDSYSLLMGLLFIFTILLLRFCFLPQFIGAIFIH
ncbi:MAG: cobalt ECF transporter T component CbiQ [Clostridiales bacterium]